MLGFCSVTKSCDSLCPMDYSTPGFLSYTVSGSLLKFMSIELMILSTISSLAAPFFCLQYFPASGSFPMKYWMLGGHRYLVRNNVLPSALESILTTTLLPSLSLLLSSLIKIQCALKAQFKQHLSEEFPTSALLCGFQDHYSVKVHHVPRKRLIKQKDAVSAWTPREMLGMWLSPEILLEQDRHYFLQRPICGTVAS